MSLYAIGDVHGCSGSLRALLEELTLGPEDHVVFVGDYVDRGPDARGVLDQLLAMEEAAALGTGPRCTFLRGNHDQMMLDWIDRGEMQLWRANGGLTTLASYMGATPSEGDIPETHVAFLRRTTLYLDTPDFCFVHAGLRPKLTVAQNLATQTAGTFLWERAHMGVAREWEKPVVCGHTPQPEPLNEPDLIDIDTGCVYFQHPDLGRLTAVKLPERAFIQVPYSG